MVAAHQAMIGILSQDDEKVYSVGEDMVLRVWQFSKQGNLQHIRHE